MKKIVNNKKTLIAIMTLNSLLFSGILGMTLAKPSLFNAEASEQDKTEQVREVKQLESTTDSNVDTNSSNTSTSSSEAPKKEVVETVNSTVQSMESMESVEQSKTQESTVEVLADIPEDVLEQETIQESTSNVSRASNVVREDVFQTTYNPKNFPVKKDCTGISQEYCNAVYKLEHKNSNDLAIEQYLIDNNLFSDLGVDRTNNKVQNGNSVVTTDGSRVFTQNNAIFREFNGKTTNIYDTRNNFDAIYKSNGIWINNKGLVIGTTLPNNTKTLTIPNQIQGITVKGIGSQVFHHYQFEAINLPDSVEMIGYESFFDSKTTTLKRPKNLTHIESSAFNDRKVNWK